MSGETDIKSQIDIILESLPDSSNQFKLNCSMNKIDITLSKLLNALHAMEGIIESHPSINNMKKLCILSLFPRKRATKKRIKFQVTPLKI